MAFSFLLQLIAKINAAKSIQRTFLLLRHAEKCLVEDAVFPWSSVHFLMLKGVMRLGFNFILHHVYMKQTKKKKETLWPFAK